MVTRNEVDTRKLFNTFTTLTVMDSDFNPKARQWELFCRRACVKRHIPAALIISIHTQTHTHTQKFKVCKWKSISGASLPWTVSLSALWSLLQKRKSKVCYLHTVPTNVLWKPHKTRRRCFTPDSSELDDVENTGAKGINSPRLLHRKQLCPELGERCQPPLLVSQAPPQRLPLESQD